MIDKYNILTRRGSQKVSNDTLMQLAQADAELPQLFTVIAQNQTAGKGQRGNSWFVSPHKNLTYSVFIKTETLSPKKSVCRK